MVKVKILVVALALLSSPVAVGYLFKAEFICIIKELVNADKQKENIVKHSSIYKKHSLVCTLTSVCMPI